VDSSGMQSYKTVCSLKRECLVPRFKALEDTVHTLARRPTKPLMDGAELVAW
jgi:hypothetical protein